MFLRPKFSLSEYGRNSRSQNTLETPNIQVKLSQYADDTTFTLRDDTSIQETFHILSLYESASGAKINLQNAKDFGPGLLNTALTNFLILTGIILISRKKFSGLFSETSIVPVST